MKSAAAVKDDVLYSAETVPPPDGEADPYNAPTKVGYLPGAIDQADISAALAPAPLPAFSSFFPPDEPNRVVAPPTISGEFERVVFETAGKKLEFERQAVDESVDQKFEPIVFDAGPPVPPPVIEKVEVAIQPIRIQEDTIIIPRPASTPPGPHPWLNLGWMVGLALLTATTVFVALWFVAGRFVH